MEAFGIVISLLQLAVLAVVSVIVLLSRTDVCALHRWSHSTRRTLGQSALVLFALLAVHAAVWAMAHALLGAFESLQEVRLHLASVIAALIGYPLYRSLESAPWLGLQVDVQREQLSLQAKALQALHRGEGLVRVIAEIDSRIAELQPGASWANRPAERVAMLWELRRALEGLSR